MPVTTLDSNTALVIIDLQKGIIGIPCVHPIDEVIARSRSLADAFRERRLPVVLVNVDGVPPGRTEAGRPAMAFPPDFADLIPELSRQPSDIVVTKKTRGAFTSTDLDATLRALAVTNIVLTGVATSAGVEATARHAQELGYNVTLAIDAMTDPDLEAHKWSVTRVFPRLGETGTTDDILSMLASTRG